MKYENKFDEIIANRPFSTDWFEERNYVVHQIMDVFYDECTFFRTCQTRNNDNEDRSRVIFFELYGSIYVYFEWIENGLIESAQLEKIKDLENKISLVMYSNIENSPEGAAIMLELLNKRKLFYWNIGLDKG